MELEALSTPTRGTEQPPRPLSSPPVDTPLSPVAAAEAASTAKTKADVCAKALELLGTANCGEPCLRVPACLYVALRRRCIAP